MPPESQPVAPAAPAPVAAVPVTENVNTKGKTSFILGIIGLVAWIIPLFGLPVTIVGLVFGVKGLNTSFAKKAKIGIILSIIGLVLSLVNASIGAYMGATGQHPVVNDMMEAQ